MLLVLGLIYTKEYMTKEQAKELLLKAESGVELTQEERLKLVTAIKILANSLGGV